MDIRFDREIKLIGRNGFDCLQSKHVAIFGIGGVGSYTVEALGRAGIGKLTIVDFDTVDITNINRQLIALSSTEGRVKVEVAKERLLDINPFIEVVAINKMYNAETADEIFSTEFDFVVDAIDMVASKLDLIERCQKNNIPVISSMGTGNKLDPSKLVVTDINKTHTCPLAKVMRKELKKRGIKKQKVIYSTEKARKPMLLDGEEEKRKQTPSSISFVPPASGLLMASEVVNYFLEDVLI